MTGKTKDINRQHRILRALVEHGPLSLPAIRKHVYKPVHADLQALRKAGYIEEVGMVHAGPAHQFRELPSFKATSEGVEYSKVELDRVFRGPTKQPEPKRAQIVITKASKATVKLKPMTDVEITYTDDTKYTAYVSKYEFKPYNPPKNFMECVR